MLKERLLYPFRFIAGAQALGLGLAVMAITAVVAYFSHTHFDGVIDTHYGASAPFYVYAAEALADWVVLTLVLYAAGRILSSSAIRLIDVAGTIALSRAPLLIAALGGWLSVPPVITDKLDFSLTPGMIGQIVLSLACTIWLVALYYQAYTISCNIKGSKGTISFIVGLLVAEVLVYQVFRLI